jgi:serine/threonine kinase 32
MGCASSKDPSDGQDMRERSKMTLKNFEKLNAIGRGGFGKVYEVRNIKTDQRYAMKEMVKTRIYVKRSVE